MATTTAFNARREVARGRAWWVRHFGAQTARVSVEDALLPALLETCASHLPEAAACGRDELRVLLPFALHADGASARCQGGKHMITRCDFAAFVALFGPVEQSLLKLFQAMGDDDHSVLAWFFGAISREEAESILWAAMENTREDDGVFLVRVEGGDDGEDDNEPATLVVAFLASGVSSSMDALTMQEEVIVNLGSDGYKLQSSDAMIYHSLIALLRSNAHRFKEGVPSLLSTKCNQQLAATRSFSEQWATEWPSKLSDPTAMFSDELLASASSISTERLPSPSSRGEDGYYGSPMDPEMKIELWQAERAEASGFARASPSPSRETNYHPRRPWTNAVSLSAVISPSIIDPDACDSFQISESGDGIELASAGLFRSVLPFSASPTEGGSYSTISPVPSPVGNSRLFCNIPEHDEAILPTVESDFHDEDFQPDEIWTISRSISTFSDFPSSGSRSFSREFGDDALARDRVHFAAFAPPRVCRRRRFHFAIWAFLSVQREEMLEHAEVLEPTARQVSSSIGLGITRGAIVTATLQVPPGFLLCSEPTQHFAWVSKVTHASFEIECTDDAMEGQAAFQATIVVGSEVAVLRAFLGVTPQVSTLDDIEPKLLKYELEVLEKTYNEIPFDQLSHMQLVGSGNFGDAYHAVYDGQEVVVKILRASEFGQATDQVVKEFEHEAATLSMLGHHPCIVPFVGACNDMHRLGLVTQYVPGGSLEDNLHGDDIEMRLPIQVRTRMLRDAACGMLNIHQAGFLHRDIAARNCLVDKHQHVKICDFGLCRRLHGFGGMLVRDAVGPFKYMAPESLAQRVFSLESDVWMFGVLMWETLSAAAPFRGMNGLEARARILRGERLVAPASAPPELAELMNACFHDVPSRRPSMAAIFHSLDMASSSSRRKRGILSDM